MIRTSAHILIESPTSRAGLRVLIRDEVDPTSAPIEFQLTGTKKSDVPTQDGWVAGSWDTAPWGSEEPDTGWARTPIVTAPDGLGAQPGERYRLWVRWSAAGESPEEPAGIIEIGGVS